MDRLSRCQMRFRARPVGQWHGRWASHGRLPAANNRRTSAVSGDDGTGLLIMLQPAPTWDEMRAQFSWGLPPALNMAVQACDAWAAKAPGQVALIDATGE